MDECKVRLHQTLHTGLAHVVWAYARLGGYERPLFDAAHAELARRAGGLSAESLAHAAWAVSAVRAEDERHRTLLDANLLHALAAAMRNHLDAPPPPPDATAATAAAAATDDSSAPQVPPTPVPLPTLLTFLLAYANLSHHDTPLFDAAAAYLAPRLQAGASPQDLVVTAYAFTRAKHRSPALLAALGNAAADPDVMNHMDDDDLVYLAAAGPGLGGHHDALMRAILSRALALAAGGGGAIRPAALLDLARCVAAVRLLGRVCWGWCVSRALKTARNCFQGLVTIGVEWLQAAGWFCFQPGHR